MAKTRRAYTGGAVSTTTSTSIASSGTTSFTITAYTGWPYGSDPFYVVVEPGTANEEKMLVTRSGSTDTTLNVYSTPTVADNRGLDGTSAVSHSSGATVYPVFTAADADEANEFASTMTAKGDLVSLNSATDFVRLGVGSDGLPLTADSAAASGLAWAQIDTAGIADDAVTAAKIATGAVTADGIATDAVGNAEIAANAVDTAELVDLAVTTGKIADDAVTTAKIAAGAITDTEVTDVAAGKITGTLGISNGGTGQTTAAAALSALGGISEGAWYSETMSNGWTNVTGRQAARVRKIGTTVQVQFTLEGGTFTNGTTIFTLNSGYRPPDILVIPIASADVTAGKSAKVTIQTSGAVQVYGLDGNTEIGASFSFSTD